MACSFHCAVSLETLFLKESRVNQDISAHVLTNLWFFGFVFYNPQVSLIHCTETKSNARFLEAVSSVVFYD